MANVGLRSIRDSGWVPAGYVQGQRTNDAGFNTQIAASPVSINTPTEPPACYADIESWNFFRQYKCDAYCHDRTCAGLGFFGEKCLVWKGKCDNHNLN
ncbi:unnamed protein product [Zymoseptoria tritici ST99CH_3D7]|uniref:Uncharacterized protein n=1 Tax=Zymoseptoria tritici (strain ST99CH_3D7) TaxID=1276538 RepID=A0A1X7RUJ4_ZYMT9|nr:unnamed protein product [Zymoseptoria tritici ST99CH_3D7]